MAGSEQRGARSAQEDLFEGSVCIFVPLPDTAPAALARMESLWRALGAEVQTMSPEAHDRLVARISHLPHLAAAALMQVIGEEEAAFAGGGLLDTTRIASGDAGLWRDICAANSAEIGAALESLVSQLEEIRELLEEENFDTLERLLSDSKARRDRLAARRGGRNPTDADQ
jgi:prephenate dehydrogenase